MDASFALERSEQRCANSPSAVAWEDGSGDLGGRLIDKAVAGRSRLEVSPPGGAQPFCALLGDDAEVAGATEALEIARELGVGERLVELRPRDVGAPKAAS